MALSHGPRRKRRNPQQIHHSNATYGRLILMLMSVVSFLFGVVNVYVWTRSEDFLQQPPPMIKNEQKKPNSKNIENVDRRHHYHGSNDTGRARVVRLLQNAGVTDLSANIVRLLPTWQQITDLYGSHPRILVHPPSQRHDNQTDHCTTFRAMVPPERRLLGSAGMFSTGTNLVTTLLKKNCYIPQRAALYGRNASKELLGIRWQVPWGKHTQQQYRDRHSTEKAKDIAKGDVLPVVTIRHPFSWMKSMCKHPYTAQWPHDASTHCPNLVKEPQRNHSTASPISSQEWIPVSVKYGAGTEVYQSLVHLFNDWYNGYAKHAQYPWIMIRMEDLVFHTQETIQKVCTCAGGHLVNKENFQFTLESAKADSPGHDTSTGLIQAWIKYSQVTDIHQWSKEDLHAAKRTLDPALMEFFGYFYQF